jgi:hypothetical protein
VSGRSTISGKTISGGGTKTVGGGTTRVKVAPQAQPQKQQGRGSRFYFNITGERQSLNAPGKLGLLTAQRGPVGNDGEVASATWLSLPVPEQVPRRVGGCSMHPCATTVLTHSSEPVTCVMLNNWPPAGFPFPIGEADFGASCVQHACVQRVPQSAAVCCLRPRQAAALRGVRSCNGAAGHAAG